MNNLSVDDMGYLIAYGDGTPEDRDALYELCFEKYHGDALVMKGWRPKDDVYDSGIIEMV